MLKSRDGSSSKISFDTQCQSRSSPCQHLTFGRSRLVPSVVSFHLNSAKFLRLPSLPWHPEPCAISKPDAMWYPQKYKISPKNAVPPQSRSIYMEPIRSKASIASRSWVVWSSSIGAGSLLMGLFAPKYGDKVMADGRLPPGADFPITDERPPPTP